MLNAVIDAILDTLKLLPFMFAAFLLLEFIEHKLNEKTHKLILKAGKIGPLAGGVLGAFPQCGFSAMAAELYATRVISAGTLVAIFLSTSDEMLIIMMQKPELALNGLKIVLIKLILGIILGFCVDIIFRRIRKTEDEHIKDFCESEHCHCEHGIFRSALHHTAKIGLFVFIITLALSISLHFLGEDIFAKIMLKGSWLSPIICSAVGLIPNCAASVAITELYISGAITFGSALAGLLSGSGIGMLILFRINRPMKQNVFILLLVFALGAVVGIGCDLLGAAI